MRSSRIVFFTTLDLVTNRDSAKYDEAISRLKPLGHLFIKNANSSASFN
jgi:hypothetical protein